MRRRRAKRRCSARRRAAFAGRRRDSARATVGESRRARRNAGDIRPSRRRRWDGGRDSGWASRRAFARKRPRARALVGGWQFSRLLHRHFGVAAENRAGSGFGAENHGPAALALVAPSELVRHLDTLLSYFLLIGSPQQVISPCSEPRVTTNSAPHFPQKYRFPVSLGT